MTIRFRLSAVMGLTALLGASVFAAPASAQMPGPYNWTGIYIGLNSGYGVAGENWHYPQATPIPSSGVNANQWLRGGLIGGTLGWNFVQTGPFVFGIEGDGDWSNISGHTTCPNVNF